MAWSGRAPSSLPRGGLKATWAFCPCCQTRCWREMGAALLKPSYKQLSSLGLLAGLLGSTKKAFDSKTHSDSPNG